MPQTVTTAKDVEDVDGRFEISSPHIQYLIDAVGRFTDEARLQIGDGLLKMLEVDAAHVALMEAGAPINNHEGEDAELYLPVDVVKKALSPVPLGEVDPIEVAWKDKRVYMSLPGGHDFSYKQQNTAGMTDPKVPDLNLPACLKVNSRLVWDAVKRANKIGADHVEFLFEDEFTITGEEEHMGHRHRSTIEVEEYIRTPGERVRSLYSIGYMRNFTCAKAFQGHVRVQLGNDFPIKVHMMPGDASVMMMMAPRIESA